MSLPVLSPARLELARRVAQGLEHAIPHPRCELDFETPFQLLVATILSAQTTDKGVNQVTPELFARMPTPRALADAPSSEVERIIKRTGYYRQKAKHIQAAAKLIAEKHGGEVPRTMEELVELPGVARKTANVILGTAFGIASGIPVDTHVRRVSQRLGLTHHDDPVKIERDLMAALPPEQWIQFGHRMVLHGRYTCTAVAPRCDACPLRAFCTYAARGRRKA